MNSERFTRANAHANPDHKAFIKKNLDIIEQVLYLLDQKDWTQKKLAQKLGKSESEVSKWLSGLHNFTVQTIVKMEQVLGSQILVTPVKYHQIVVKELQRKVVDELMNLVTSSSFKLQNQILTHRDNKIHNWTHASPIVVKTTVNKHAVKRPQQNSKLSDYPLQAA